MDTNPQHIWLTADLPGLTTSEEAAFFSTKPAGRRNGFADFRSGFGEAPRETSGNCWWLASSAAGRDICHYSGVTGAIGRFGGFVDTKRCISEINIWVETRF